MKHIKQNGGLEPANAPSSGRSKRFIIAVIVLGAIGLVLADVFGVDYNVGSVVGGIVVVVLLVLSWCSFCKEKDRPLPKDFDSDAGIDWEEKGGCVDVYAKSGSLVLLVPDIAVFEADPICAEFKESGIRFKLERKDHVPVFSRFGRGGIDSRMCIWVHCDDFDKAKPIADRLLKISV